MPLLSWMLKEDMSRVTATQRNEAGRRQPAEVKSSPTVLLPAAGNQYGKEVNVLKKKRHFLPDHQDLEGELD